MVIRPTDAETACVTLTLQLPDDYPAKSSPLITVMATPHSKTKTASTPVALFS
jgi:hypothetical protein